MPKGKHSIRKLAVLDNVAPRDVCVTLYLAPEGHKLEFRKKASRHPYRITLESIWKALDLGLLGDGGVRPSVMVSAEHPEFTFAPGLVPCGLGGSAQVVFNVGGRGAL